ncbi:hypothetical protein QQS21_012847 [Conoideocrella luteorostrata]|uniref:Uncharacterized protein n=1 Tax=Conoideocrella luteorostrata TaxID=1105319 RepID=A0AAJ0CD53_9HYPO|nr:hypothetical protein QQS21_012847 [Conoideocrella luteorostrata]
MSEDTVKKMGDELIRLCDGIERHGLVDYQYGVWEEQIEAALEDCLDAFDEEKDLEDDLLEISKFCYSQAEEGGRASPRPSHCAPPE